MHEVLVNRLGGLSLPRKSVVRLTDRLDMTLDVYRGRKTTMQQQQQLYHLHMIPKQTFSLEGVNYVTAFERKDVVKGGGGSGNICLATVFSLYQSDHVRTEQAFIALNGTAGDLFLGLQ